MHFPTLVKVAPFAMILAFNAQAGCGTDAMTTSDNPGGTDPMTTNPAEIGQATGYLELGAAKAVSRDYQEVNLNIQAIEALDVSTGKWLTVATPNRTINIMDQASVEAVLAAQVKLAVGHYTKLRLVLGAGCSIKLADGSVHALNLQSELKAGIQLDVDLDIKLGATLRAVLDLDLSSCIQIVKTDGADWYYLRPLFRIIDRAHIGSITGVVKAKLTGQVLAGALVSAEWFDAAGRPHVELTAIADINGRFSLDRLPLGKKYHVVCRPLLGGALWFDAAASIELDLSVATHLETELNLDVGLDLTLGATAAGRVSPMVSLDAADKVELVKFLSCGSGCNKWFVVAGAMASVGVKEEFSFNLQTQGRYAVQSCRQHCQNEGYCSWDPIWTSLATDVTLGLYLNLDIDLHL